MVSSQAELALHFIGHGTDRLLRVFTFMVTQAAALNEKAEGPFAVLVLAPTITVGRGIKRKFPRLFQAPSKPVVQFPLEPINASVLDGILEPGMPAVAAVTVIPLDLDHLLGHLHGLLGGTETDHVG